MCSFEQSTQALRSMPHVNSKRRDMNDFSLPKIHCHHRWNWTRYLVAASTASSTFSGCGPLLTHVDPFPTAFPPTTSEILAAHSLAERPALPACYKNLLATEYDTQRGSLRRRHGNHELPSPPPHPPQRDRPSCPCSSSVHA